LRVTDLFNRIRFTAGCHQKKDRFKLTAEKILEKIASGELKGVYASTAAIQEVVFWFCNRQLYRELTTAVNAISHLPNVEWCQLPPKSA
jgi:hypothetical protein